MGTAIMGATMLDENCIIGVPFGTGNWWPKICMWGSQAQPLFIAKLGSLSHVSHSAQTEVTQTSTLELSSKTRKIFDN